MEALLFAYVYPFYQFVQCWISVCAPVTFPWR